jgi:multiple sugar transport system permease protein
MSEGLLLPPILEEPTAPVVGDGGAPSRRRRVLPFSGWHFFLLPLSLVMLVPLVWSVITSIEVPSEADRFPPDLLPKVVTLHNYAAAWQQAPFGRWFINTTIVTGAIVIGDVLLSSLAAYAFARVRFFGREVLFIVFLATLMVPFQLVMIPTFLITKDLGLINTLGGLIVPNVGSVFGIFLLRQFFRTLPAELEEAARLDGASRLGVLFKIILPLSIPVIVTLILLDVLNYWNDFLWPLLIINSQQNMTLQLGLSTFQGAHASQTNWPVLMSGTVMSQLPLLALFFFAQRYFVRSIAFSGIK